MKVLIDTNVILDVLCNRSEFVEGSSRVWKYCEVNQIKGYISALSVPNIVYILCKELAPQKTQQLIQQILMIFEVIDLKSSDLKNAAEMLSSDFEDTVQCAVLTASKQITLLPEIFVISKKVKFLYYNRPNFLKECKFEFGKYYKT
ncbi:putative uncharacterized protein [Ruminococcus sp. CAG:624]|nr:putative uncharacterized protein [Ruminococcus sp. CAG:624]